MFLPHNTGCYDIKLDILVVHIDKLLKYICSIHFHTINITYANKLVCVAVILHHRISLICCIKFLHIFATLTL